MAAVKWTPKRILYEIHERGMTLERLAIDNNRNPKSFRLVWKRPNAVNEQIIATFVGVPVEQLWPERYPKSSSRILDTKKYGAAQSQKTPEQRDRVAA